MPTDKQLHANRENAAHSTGPNTFKGKLRSSQNAHKHGLTGAQIVVTGESPEEYEMLKAQMLEEWQPANLDEEHLVLQIASSWWRLQRGYRMEASMLILDAQTFGNNPDSEKAVANGFWNNFPRYETLRRYIGSIERAWNRAKDELRRVQAERRKQELPPKPVKPEQISKIGFVSSPLPEAPAQPAAKAPKPAPGASQLPVFSPLVPPQPSTFPTNR